MPLLACIFRRLLLVVGLLLSLLIALAALAALLVFFFKLLFLGVAFATQLSAFLLGVSLLAFGLFLASMTWQLKKNAEPRKKLRLQLFIIFLSSLLISFLIAQTAGINRDLRYPLSLVKDYSLTKRKQEQVITDREFVYPQFKSVHIFVIATDISILSSPDEKIFVHMAGSANQRVQFEEQGAQLSVRVAERPEQEHFVFSFDEQTLPKLEVRIPGGASDFEIYAQSDSGNVKADGVRAKTIQFMSASGDLRFLQSESDLVKLESQSGWVRVQGKANTLSAASASGELRVQLDKEPSSISIHSVSGSVSLSLPPVLNAKFKFKTISGELNLRRKGGVQKAESLIYGTGKNEIRLETTSGDVTFE